MKSMQTDNHLAKLMQASKFLSKFAEHSGHVYWISSHDFKTIQYISPAYEKIWGRSREELYSSPEKWISYLHPEDAALHHPIHDMAEKLAQEGEAARLVETYRIIRPDGQIRWIIDRGFPVFDDKGLCYGVTGVAVDITDEKLKEQALREAKEAAEIANIAKTEFLENMRHDIRTPLTGIVGFADILKSEATEPRIKEYADCLVASSHALLDLLDEVLESVRVSSGEIPLLKKKFDIQHSLKQVIALNLAKAQQKNLALSLDIDQDLPRYLIGDKIRIHRIVLELVTNALNFTDTGFVKVQVKLMQNKGRDLVIQISVTDSGIGIPKDKQQDIYLQFKRLSPSYKGIYKGAGLGLYVVKQFIEELEGEIYVKSALQEGTTFNCLIPLQASLLDDATGLDETILDKPIHSPMPTIATESISSNAYKHRILLVEDNHVAQTIAKTFLNQLNCQVDIADYGNQAIALWQQNHYDLIFMDIGLADREGDEVTRLIRAQEVENHIPIIALTAHLGEENRKRCIQAGMDAVISKPLTQAQCKNIIDSFIQTPAQKTSIMQAPKLIQTSTQDNKALFELEQFSLLDLDEALNNTGDENILSDVFKLLLQQSLPDDLQAIKAAYALKDWQRVQALAHKIKGGAVYIGTIRLKMACQYLEHYWKSGQVEALDDLYQQILSVIDDTVECIELWLTT